MGRDGWPMGSRALIRANVSPIQLIGLLFFVLWRDEPRRQRLTTACRKSLPHA